ncbi:MAG: HlyD family type I secretion periplasmic adaptor subunit [Acetobacteraceae bacterium]|nr:HlyD family type I secretion periplasmic adaptor subunit [Acetobacteraceae bacterium]
MTRAVATAGRESPPALADARRVALPPPVPATGGPLLVGLLSLGVFIGGFAAWSSHAPLAEAAIAMGEIRAEGQRRTIQHLEGGIVQDILARDGDRVRAGQVLLRLDTIQSGAQTEALRAQRLSLLAQEARLAAEANGLPAIAFPRELLVSADPRAEEAMAGQRALFAARNAAFAGQMAAVLARREQQQATLAAIAGQAESQARQLDLMRQEEESVRRLVAQGLERMPRLLALQRQMAALEGNRADLEGQAARAQAVIAELDGERARLEQARRAEIATERREVATRLAEVSERLRAAEDVSTRREVVAPEDGTILHSRVFTRGAVLRPGERVMELVPARDRLLVEVQLSPADIERVHPGLHAEIRLPAYRQRIAPYLEGEVVEVAADVTHDERRGAAYYRVRIVIPEDQIARLPSGPLRPGMPAEALIRTGERSLARYLAQPLLDSFHRAFRER